MKLIISILVLITVSSSVCIAQEDSINIKIKSVRLEFTSVLFINDATGLVNIEFFTNKTASIGLEPSISFVGAGSFGGDTYGSPFSDYNLMLYSLSKIGEPTSIKFTLGYALRTSAKNYTKDFPDGQIRIGCSFYWDFLKYFGLCIRLTAGIRSTQFSGSGVGIGLSFNWTQ